jgi:Multidrug resistance efflux pump
MGLVRDLCDVGDRIWSPGLRAARRFRPTEKPAAVDDAGKAGSGDVVLEAKGYIIPSRTYQVSPKVAGMVEKLYIEKEGDRFKEGDKLAILEDVDYTADRDHSSATLKNAQERLAQLRKELPEEIEKAKAELERRQKPAKAIHAGLGTSAGPL